MSRCLSSLGGWLSILALTSLATILTRHDGFATQNYAVGGVLILGIAPAVLFRPLAGAIAERLDRRVAMVVGDLVRFGLYLSIPLVDSLPWLLVAGFLAQCVAVLWMPAEGAVIPNLVPRSKLARANQFSLLGTYGSAPVAAALFVVLALVNGGLMHVSPFFRSNPTHLALYIDALTFLVAAIVIANLRELSVPGERAARAPSVPRQIADGWRYGGRTPLVRGLAIGMAGALAAGGAVIGVARVYVLSLGGGNAGYGVVFGAVFVGLAFGMFVGPRLLRGFSRRRLFALALIGAACALAAVALITNLPVVTFLTLFLGGCAGVAWVIGHTLIGRDVDDAIRGRTFAFARSLAAVVLLFVVVIVPLVAGVVGTHPIAMTDHVTYEFDGTNVVLLIVAVLVAVVGVVAYRQMDEHSDIPLWRELYGVLRGVPYEPADGGRARSRGMLIAFEGGEGVGKSTQASLLAIRLREHGFDVVTTHEPGATKIGMRLRAILLDKSQTAISPRTETLLYAADRAQHVAEVITPALERGAVVITDRFIDSTLAYQGAGRNLSMDEMAYLNRWATGGLIPDLTFLLDLPPREGLSRNTPDADRIEAEPLEFHERVREQFRRLAAAAPERYLVIDAAEPVETVRRQIEDQARRLLPDPVPVVAEQITGTIPIIKD